ncbi:translation initiation factor IF-3, partial [bacterium]|nr:translation initiation factor IF-3 [bacterium]
KYRYEMEKKEKEARKNRKIIKLKEIKMTPKIEQHDYDTKMKKIRAFIDEGDRVKITIFFKGRMMAHKDLGHKLLKKIMGELEEVVKVEKPSSMQGRQLTMVVSPIKGK